MRTQCGQHGPRVICWGGYSSTTSSLVTDMAVLWPGVPVVNIQQQLPMELQQQLPVPVLQHSSILSAMETALRRSVAQDALCFRKFGIACR